MKKDRIAILGCITGLFALCLTGCGVLKFGSNDVLRNAGDFSDGVAWAKRVDKDDPSDPETVLLDTDGKVLFRTDEPVETSPFHGGVGCYVEDGVTYILDTNGREIANSEDMGFEKVEAYDAGVLLVSKGGADGTKYGVVNMTGQWVREPETIQLPNSFLSGNGVFSSSGPEEIRASYIGDDVFAIYAYFATPLVTGEKLENYSSDWVFFNWRTGDVFYLMGSFLGDVNYLPAFHDGKAYFPFPFAPGENEFASTTLIKAPDMQDGTEIKSAFTLSFKGRPEEIEDVFNYTSGDRLLTEYKDWLDEGHLTYNGYYRIKNVDTGKTIDFREYTREQIHTIDFSYGYGMITFEGRDGEDYFTVIDDDGSIVFEPIAYTDVAYSETNIVYQSPDGYNIIDLDGNILAEDLEYSKVGPVVDGLAVATDREKNCCYIDVNGDAKIEK